MGVIDKVRSAIGDNEEPVRFSFWGDLITVSLWEKEVSIDVYPNGEEYHSVVFDTEGYDFKLDVGQMEVLAKVMGILLDNMEELKLYAKIL